MRTYQVRIILMTVLMMSFVGVGVGSVAAQQATVETKQSDTFNPAVETPEDETVDVEVTVIDSNGNPIEGAVVELEDRGGSPDDRTATTGSDGKIRFVEPLGPPPENCQTVKLRLDDGGSRSADLGCRNGGSGVAVSHTFQVSTGLSPNNPFGDANGDPVGVSDASDVLFEWNQNNGVVDGVNISLSDMADFLFGWNQARN